MPPETTDLEIAVTAARLIVDDGLEYGPAKRRAVQQLGLPARTRLPDNDVVEAAVREHLAIFCADTQPAELAALRSLALTWMARLRPFRPHLTGAVWNGTATRLTDIWLQLFCDDPKSIEIELINQRVTYAVGQTQGFTGRTVEVLSVSTLCPGLGEDVGVHLVLYNADELRGAHKPDASGRRSRGNEAAVQQLLISEATPQ